MSASSTDSCYNYRPDIDGLRAIAVLSVILFHINEKLLPGGFIGVDIFFVISGYLISLHILRDLSRDRFSIIEFYRRRIKRIAPAMLVLVLVVIVISQSILHPEDAEKAAKSGLWSLMSLANVYFWLFQDTSYFAADSNQLPLLHLWSLGVEEQFYIFWPLILLFSYRLGRTKHFFAIFGAVAVASYLAGEFFFSRDPSFVYYMLPTRAGELLVGALLAQFIMQRGRMELSRNLVSIVALAGGVLILASLLLLSEDDVFPGLRAIPPTLGAAMLIFAGHYGQSLPTRLLRLRPMVWVGLISYSAYLWHWPLLAFFRYGQPNIPLPDQVVIFCITLLLAWLSYRYIETPARRSNRKAVQIFIRQYIIPAGAIAFLAVLSVKLDGYGLRWFSDDYKETLMTLRDEVLPDYRYSYVCHRLLIKPSDVDNMACVVGNDENMKPKVILWGDSNAAHYIGAIGAFAEQSNFSFRNLEIGACPPIDADASDYVQAKRLADCRKSRDLVINAVKDYQIVIISADWLRYQEKSDQFMDVFFDTVQSLLAMNKKVILLGKAPIFASYDRLCREKSISYPFISCKVPDVPLDSKIAALNQRLKKFAKTNGNVSYYDFNKYLCPDGICSVYDEAGKLMYYDSSHLALMYSWEIGRKVVDQEGVPYPFNMIPQWENNERISQRDEIRHRGGTHKAGAVGG